MGRDEHALVTQAVEDHIGDTGKLPSTTDVLARVTLGSGTTRATLEDLVNRKQLVAAYEAPKNPTIYLPAYMYEAVLRKQRTPQWVAAYGFSEAQEIQDKIRDQERQLEHFRKIESLLYSTGRMLEEAVEEAFRLLEFEGLEMPYEDPDSWDLSFVYDEVVFIFDVKGKGRWADKKDVAQLQQWLQKYADENAEVDAASLRGGLIVNHFRDLPPSDRWPVDSDRKPLSEAGERYLKIGSGVFLTTTDLFEVSKKVDSGELSKQAGREELVGALRRSTDA